jgi:hypothetical protein
MDKQELQKSAEAKSDQIDADDMIGNITMDVTIEAVKRGTSEQPIQLVLKETEKFYRPNKTFRRALIGCFGDEPANWVGQRLRLARDPNVMWGGVKVGGVIVSHASIEAPMVFMLQAKRGKKSAVSIDVIPAPQKPTPMPEKVKAAAAAVSGKRKPAAPAEQSISGDPDEGNLDIPGVFEPVKPTQDKLDAMLGAFQKQLGMTQQQVEKECNFGPVSDWTVEQFDEAREVFKAMRIERAAIQQGDEV